MKEADVRFSHRLILTFYLEPVLALKGLQAQHGLVPNLALVDGLVVVDGRDPAEAAGGAAVGARLLDPEARLRAGRQRLLVPEPSHVGLRVSAGRVAVELVLLAFACRVRQRARRDCGRLRGDY